MPRASSRSSSSAARSSRFGRVERAGPVGVELGAQQPQREREHDEPLLGAVVEVALEPPARGVAGLDGPGARRAELLELRARLRLQALVVEREAGGGADVLEQPRVVEQLGAVDEDGDRPPAAHERRHRAAVCASAARPGGRARRHGAPCRAGRRARARGRRARGRARRAACPARARR